MSDATAPGKTTRVYRSLRRQQQARLTRERIIAAATDQFLKAGYAATTMRAVADTAGVSVATVELVFGTKPQLLKAAIDVAIAGDDEPVGVLQRDWAATAQATADVTQFLTIVGQALRHAALRAAGLVVVAYEAAPSDADIKGLTLRLGEQRAITVAWIVDGITARSPLRSGTSRSVAIDTIWLLMDPVVFQRLTRDRGWSSEQFEGWFTDSIARLLLPVISETGTAPVGTWRGRRSRPP